MRMHHLLALLMIFLVMNGAADGYDDTKTHPDLTENSISFSKLDEYLRSNLGLTIGTDTPYNGKPIVELFRSGSTNEDKPLTRSRNHFWNSLNNKGLDDWPYAGDPNRDWAMGLIEANEYSWEDAREAYYAALTSTTEWEREEHFIRMYECLGRVLHLIEDMGVPVRAGESACWQL